MTRSAKKLLKVSDKATYATGKKKNAIAKVWIQEGTGQFIINNEKIENYFPLDFHRMIILHPFSLTESNGKYDVIAQTIGGGKSGQAFALRHGCSIVLAELESESRTILKSHSLLTRDSRVVERKKYGRKKARKRFQFSKR